MVADDGSLVPIGEVAKTHLTRSAVGFLDLTNKKPESLGSGTFVRFGTKVGLLTCAHVVHELERRARLGHDDVGIVAFPARQGAIQNLVIPFSKMSPTRVGDPPYTDGGPDIGFLQLSSSDNAALAAQLSVIDGDAQRAISVRPQPDLAAIEAVVGVVNSWTKMELLEGQRSKATIHGLATTGRIRRDQVAAPGGHLVYFEIEPEQDIELPASYEGTSGGAIWRLFYKMTDDGEVEVVEKRLTGVAFYQAPGMIIGHGPSTIYNTLRSRILEG